jgi:hypothetical protein
MAKQGSIRFARELNRPGNGKLAIVDRYRPRIIPGKEGVRKNWAAMIARRRLRRPIVLRKEGLASEGSDL